jgi:hypothetical protein
MIDILIFVFKYLPVIFIHLFVIASAIGLAISFVAPSLLPYKTPLRYGSILALAISLYFEGAHSVVTEYEARSKEWNQKVTEAENKSSQVNTEIKYVYRDRVQVVKDVQVVIQEKIRDVAVNIDSQCRVTNDTIQILNDSAKNVKR